MEQPCLELAGVYEASCPGPVVTSMATGFSAGGIFLYVGLDRRDALFPSYL